jgi:SagB-type dehydrogenase family enzyme
MWPTEWSTVYYKKYNRFPYIPLPKKEEIGRNFSQVISNRSSKREYKGETITSQELSTWISHVCGEISTEGQKTRRTYPSGGARYPIEHYLILLKDIDDIVSGIYHYRYDGHGLELMLPYQLKEKEVEKITTATWVKESAFIHVMTGVFWRSMNKYGERGYRHILLEAGHIGQNDYLVSSALGLASCALSGISDYNLERMLDLNPEEESVFHAVVVGK